MNDIEYPGHTIHRYAISHGVSWEEAERRFDAFIAKELGMDPDEVLRLKQVTGLAALFKDREFSKAWEETK